MTISPVNCEGLASIFDFFVVSSIIMLFIPVKIELEEAESDYGTVQFRLIN
jgi:hypothetical protein